MSSNVLIWNGGAYFTDERIQFFPEKHGHNIDQLNWEDVHHCRKICMPHDRVVIFGLKTITRRLRKARVKPKAIRGLLGNFFEKNIPPNMPVGVLDDWNSDDENDFGDFLRSLFLSRFNCKFYLLREYLSNKTYHPLVFPFSIPCRDFSHLSCPLDQKQYDLYFRGNSSSPDRRNIINQLSKLPYKSLFKVYDGGEKSDAKLDFDRYLRELSMAKFCLHFKGAGYCCFRYQEIASVGSIIVSPAYPFVVDRDYVDMVSCVKYRSPEELDAKLTQLVKCKDKLEDMQFASSGNFQKNHTNIARYQRFVEYLEKL